MTYPSTYSPGRTATLAPAVTARSSAPTVLARAPARNPSRLSDQPLFRTDRDDPPRTRCRQVAVNVRIERDRQWQALQSVPGRTRRRARLTRKTHGTRTRAPGRSVSAHQPQRSPHCEQTDIEIKPALRVSPSSSASPRSSRSAGSARLSSRPCMKRSADVFQRRASVYSGNQRLGEREAHMTRRQRAHWHSGSSLFSVGSALPCRVKWLYVSDTKAVIADSERWRRKREPGRRLPPCRQLFVRPPPRVRASATSTNGPAAMPAGFHHVALLSDATATNAPPIPAARPPTVSVVLGKCRRTRGRQRKCTEWQRARKRRTAHEHGIILVILISQNSWQDRDERGSGIPWKTPILAGACVQDRQFACSPDARGRSGPARDVRVGWRSTRAGPTSWF